MTSSVTGEASLREGPALLPEEKACIGRDKMSEDKLGSYQAEGEGSECLLLEASLSWIWTLPTTVSKGLAGDYLCAGPGLVPGPWRLSPIVTVRKGNCPQLEPRAEGSTASCSDIPRLICMCPYQTYLIDQIHPGRLP